MRPVPLEPGTKDTFSLLQSSLQSCVQDHTTCAREQDPLFHPTRLVHIDPKDPDGKTLRLVDTSGHRPTTRYICLSYCWGTESHLVTTQDNLKAHLECIPWSNLSRCHQDCMKVARELGIRYVWVDALCIVQRDLADLAYHSQRMQSIYQNALLTVSVVGSETSSMPFLGSEAPDSRAQYPIHELDVDTETGGILKFRTRNYNVLLDFLEEEVKDSLWTRAWAWQEQMFSRRIVYFFGHKTMWKCYESQFCEAGQKNGETYDYTRAVFDDELYGYTQAVFEARPHDLGRS